MVSKIVLYASEVSSVCGLNPYRKIHDTFAAVLKRISSIKVETKEERVEKQIKQIDIDDTIAILIDAAASAESIEDVHTIAQSIDSVIPLTIPESDRVDIAKSIESQMNRGFGTKQEAPAIAKYEAQQNTSVGRRNDKFHSRKITTIDGCSIIVGGKVDGIKEDGTVIEVKNRMHRFFDPLPEYDIAQLQTYLFILRATKGELVEQLKGNTIEVKTTEIDVDIDMWNTIIEPRIIEFCQALIKLMNDSDLQYKFKSGSDLGRERIVHDLMH